MKQLYRHVIQIQHFVQECCTIAKFLILLDMIDNCILPRLKRKGLL